MRGEIVKERKCTTTDDGLCLKDAVCKIVDCWVSFPGNDAHLGQMTRESSVFKGPGNETQHHMHCTFNHTRKTLKY